MANEGGPTLEQQIHSLEQWINLINDRIDNIQVPENVRNDIRAQFNIVQLRENINHYRRTYDRNNQLIFHGERIDVDLTEDENAAIETAKNELISLENIINLFNHSIVDVIDNRLRQNIQNIGGRRVCKRGRENRSRSSSARKLSSRSRRRSSKSRATKRKPKRRQRSASRRAY